MTIVGNIIGGSLAVFQITDRTVWQKEAIKLLPEPSPFPEARTYALSISPGSGLPAAQETNQAIRLISWLYQFRDFQAVASFLRKNPKLIPLLVEAYGQICLRFGSQHSLALELFSDPEATSDEGLVATVRVHMSPEQAGKLMDEFDLEWWLDALPRADHKLTIALEYV